MPRPLTYHTPDNPNIKDWDKTREIGAAEIRKIKSPTKGSAQSKLATSIPTPFARIYLFETALEIIKENHNGTGPYHRMVSDLLDLFQVLYDRGNDKKYFTYRKWNRLEETAKLHQSNKRGHKLLADSLDMFFLDESRFRGLTELHLIYYQGILVGGTSPITILYTAPSWERDRLQAGVRIPSTDERDLFDGECCPLHARDEDFQIFMHKFRLAFQNKLDTTAGPLLNYIRQNGDRYNKYLFSRLPEQYTERDFASEYSPISLFEESNDFLQAVGVAIRQRKIGSITDAISQASELAMLPTVNNYMHYTAENGKEVTIHTPLALVSPFNAPLRYVNGIWDEKTIVIDNPDIPLHERELPGKHGMKFPYLTTGDFIEDSVIEVPFDINRRRFFSGANEDLPILLPIKKDYFNYFTLEDLKQNLQLERKLGDDGNLEKIIVRLKVPLDNDTEYNTITFSRTFVAEPKEGEGEIIGADLNLGIFPFYKLKDEPDLNRYAIMLADDESRAPELGFYTFEDCRYSGRLPAEKTERSPKQKPYERTTYFKLGDSFDLIELQVGIHKATIIPEMRPIINESQSSTFLFSVDFGTTNTYIAYQAYTKTGTLTLDITPEDMQMVLLNQPGEGMDLSKAEAYTSGFGEMPNVATFRNREFVPSVIGKGSRYQFPVRTAVCESKNFQTEKVNLFANVNIGFSVDTETRSLNNNSFVTQIKWGFENQRDKAVAENRVYAYFIEALWLIKNKVILNQGNIHNTRISWFLPISMSRAGKGEYRKLWKQAHREVFGPQARVKLLEEEESVVPFYALREQFGFYTQQDALNIDIGGGTSDLLFFSISSRRNLSTSFRFAGNDIWGDGLTNSKKHNGIFRLMNKKAKGENLNLSPTTQEQYKTIKNNPQFGSEDLIAYMFKHDDEFHISKTLRGSGELRIIFIFHLAAIIWHISKYMDYHKVAQPLYITFTGKGSEYLKLISEDEKDLTDLIKIFIAKFAKNKPVNGLSIFLPQNPKEITAQGGVLKLKSELEAKEEKLKTKKLHYYGVENTFLQKGESPPKETVIQDIHTLLTVAQMEFDQFIDVLLDDIEIRRLLTEFEIKTNLNKLNLKSFMNQQSRLSFTEMAKITLQNTQDDDLLPETMFFWGLKGTLFTLIKELTGK